MGVGDQDVADLARRQNLFLGFDMAGNGGARIDHRHTLAGADNVDPGAPEGEWAGIGRQNARHQRRQAHLDSGGHVQRTVEIHALLTRETQAGAWSHHGKAILRGMPPI